METLYLSIWMLIFVGAAVLTHVIAELFPAFPPQRLPRILEDIETMFYMLQNWFLAFLPALTGAMSMGYGRRRDYGYGIAYAIATLALMAINIYLRWRYDRCRRLSRSSQEPG